MNRSMREVRCQSTAIIVLLSQARLPALDPEKRITQLVHTAWTPREGAPSRHLAEESLRPPMATCG